MIPHLIVANFAADFGRNFGPLDIGDVMNQCVGAGSTLRSMPHPNGSNSWPLPKVDSLLSMRPNLALILKTF